MLGRVATPWFGCAIMLFQVIALPQSQVARLTCTPAAGSLSVVFFMCSSAEYTSRPACSHDVPKRMKARYWGEPVNAGPVNNGSLRPKVEFGAELLTYVSFWTLGDAVPGSTTTGYAAPARKAESSDNDSFSVPSPLSFRV